VSRILIIFIIALVFKTEAQTSVLNVADSLYLHGNYTKAIQQYKTYNNQAEVYNKIAKAYIAIGNYDKAINNYKEAIKSNSNDALIKYDYGKLLYRTKKYKEASNEFNKLVKIDSLNPNYQYELGLSLEKLKDSTTQKRFHNAFKLDKTHQKAIFKIAKYYVQKRKHKQAEEYINIGLESYQNNLSLISLKAQNYYWKQDYDNASKWFEKLLKLGESSEFIHEKLSLCYYQNYEYEKAVVQRKLALKYNPTDATAIYIIGTYYQELNNFAKAEEYIKKALLLLDQPLDREYAKLGTILNHQKKHKEAIVAIKKAIKEDPTNESTNFHLAITLETYYADFDAKIKMYEDFKKKFPNGPLSKFADYRISEIKKEKFIKEGEKED